ncbi:MAG: hypothetical protein U9Q27_03455 [Patescibacteria group bacterium]|nr:hypothetical protein [Patescibacteria group bacterium]
MVTIELKISETMDNVDRAYPYLENRITRISLEKRTTLGINLGTFIFLKGKKGDILTLQVANAFSEDVIDDPSVIYVTSKTFNKIGIKQYTNNVSIETVGDITLGCDPEAFLIDKSTKAIISASRFFQKWTQVGFDGHMMELRPFPSTNEIVLLNNIYHLILSARKILNHHNIGKQCKILGVSHYGTFTAGFHLHFGLPPILLKRQPGTRSLIIQMVSALDYYVGIPSIIPEGTVDSFRRTVPYLDYGKPGNYRLNNRTLEYRVPGGYLLRHPILTLGLISIGALVVEDIISRIKVCTDNFMEMEKVATHTDIIELYPHLPDIKELLSTICSTSTKNANKHLSIIEADFEKMLGWKKREIYIKQFIGCIKNNIIFTDDIEYNWRNFYNAKQYRQMVVH